MRKQTCLLVLAMSIIVLAAGVWMPGASRAAEDCLTKPGPPPPQGSHWYYRLDRANNRQCWYLGAEGGKVRAHSRQAARTARSQGGKPSASVAEESADAGPVPAMPAQAFSASAVPAQPIPAQAAPVETTTGQAEAEDDDAVPVSPTQWSSLPGPPVSNERPADRSPLTSPIASPAAPAPIQASQAPSATQWYLLLLALLGFATTAVAVTFAVFALRGPRGAHAQGRPAARPRARPAEGKASPARARSRSPAQQAERPVQRVRPSPPPSPVDEIEFNVRRLLHELQRRGNEPRAGERSLRRVNSS